MHDDLSRGFAVHRHCDGFSTNHDACLAMPASRPDSAKARRVGLRQFPTGQSQSLQWHHVTHLLQKTFEEFVAERRRQTAATELDVRQLASVVGRADDQQLEEIGGAELGITRQRQTDQRLTSCHQPTVTTGLSQCQSIN